MQVVELLIRKLESEPSFHRKVDLFFLVDSITQCSHSHKGRKTLENMVKLMNCVAVVWRHLKLLFLFDGLVVYCFKLLCTLEYLFIYKF